MNEEAVAQGCVKASKSERAALAAASHNWNRKNSRFTRKFYVY